MGHLSIEVAAYSFNQSCTAPFVCCHSSGSDRPKISWGVETSDDYLVQGEDYMEDVRKCQTWTICTPANFLVLHISTASFEQPTSFPHIPFLHLIIAYTKKVCLCTSAGRKFSEFKILVIDRTLQVAGFSRIHLRLQRTVEKMRTTYYAIGVFPLTFRRRMSLRGSARVNCEAAIRDRFILAGRALMSFQ